MATPDGTIAEPSTTKEPQAIVAEGTSYEERQSLAYGQLEAGASIHEINRGYNEPLKKPDEVKEAAKESPDEATGATDEKPKPEEKPAKADPKDDDRQTDLTIATRALKRDSWTDEDLKGLSDDRIIEMGQKRLAVQQDIDRKFSEAKPKSEGESSTETNPDTDSIYESIAEYDDDLSEQVKTRFAALEQERKTLETDLAKAKLGIVVDKAKLEFPQLEDPAVFDQVLAKARDLGGSPVYTTPGDAFTDACNLVLGKQREQAAQEQLLKSNQSERDGQVDSFVDTDETTKPLTEDEKQSLAFKLLGQDFSPDEVRARLKKIPDAKE